MASHRRQTFDAQQQEIPPKRKGRFYRQPGDTGNLPGKFYSQQTEKPSGGKGKFYSRDPDDAHAPEGHFFRDRSMAASTGDLDEAEALAEKLDRRSAKVRRRRGKL